MVAPLFRRKGFPQHKFPAQLGPNPSPIGSFVAAAPQFADYALVVGLGFFSASAVTPQGQANAAEYTFGTHAVATHNAEAAKTKVWGSLRTPPVVLTGPVPPLVLAFPQVDLTRQGSVFSSVRTPPAVSTGPVPPLILASPQAADLSISGWVEPGAPQADGPVPGLTQTLGQDPPQLKPSIWASLRTPPVVSGTIGATVLTLPQYDDRPTRQTWAPLNGKTPPLITSFYAAQLDPTQIQPKVWGSIASPPLTSGILAPFFGVPPQIEDRPWQAVWPAIQIGTVPVASDSYSVRRSPHRRAVR